MDEAASIDNWNHTSELMALLANLQRDPEQTPEPYHPQQFHPHHQEEFAAAQDENFDAVDFLERSGL